MNSCNILCRQSVMQIRFHPDMQKIGFGLTVWTRLYTHPVSIHKNIVKTVIVKYLNNWKNNTSLFKYAYFWLQLMLKTVVGNLIQFFFYSYQDYMSFLEEQKVQTAIIRNRNVLKCIHLTFDKLNASLLIKNNNKKHFLCFFTSWVSLTSSCVSMPSIGQYIKLDTSDVTTTLSQQDKLSYQLFVYLFNDSSYF